MLVNIYFKKVHYIMASTFVDIWHASVDILIGQLVDTENIT